MKGIKWDLGVLSPAGVLCSGHTALLRGICPGVEALSLPGKLAGFQRFGSWAHGGPLEIEGWLTEPQV